jgi:hypothetical protein
MGLLLTKPDDSALTGLTLTAERAVPSAHVALKIKNDGLLAVSGAFLTLYAEATPGSGEYVTSGHAVVDELMGRFQITGQDSSATAGQEIVLGVVQPMGHLAVGLLPTILPGDWILADFWIAQAGSSAGGGSVNIKLEVANEVAAYPLPFGVSSVGTGVDTGKKQPRSFLVSGRGTTATGTPDDYVHVAAGSWLLEGEEYADASIEDVQFNQHDGASATLASGEAYIAALTQGTGSTPTVTKGTKAVLASVTKPTPPAGELILAWITVKYNASLTNIVTANIESDLTYGRYLVTVPASGLTATVHAGEAVIADFRQVRGTKGTVVLGASVTNRIWLEYSGALTVNTSDTPPSAGAVKLAEAVTDGSHVTSLSDTRTYIQTTVTGVLEVKEADGSPDVTGVTVLKVPNGSLTDHGGGTVEIAFPTGLASASTGLTASEGVKRSSGTDLSTAAALKLDVDGLTALAALPDVAADEVAIWDNSASVHKKLLLKYLGGQDYRQDITGDGATQPTTLSPLPLPGCVPMVFKDGLIAKAGAVDYTDDGMGGIVYTPVLALGQSGVILWRG